MNIIICLDEKGGVSFNERRQSRDSAVCEKILSITEGSRLLMDEYSAKLFTEADNITVPEDFPDCARAEDFCFFERVRPDLSKAEGLYIFLWNRTYPSDLKWELAPETEGFVLCSSEEFKGSSHEKITLNIYRKEK